MEKKEGKMPGRLAISTVYRPKNYLHKLIVRLPKKLPIRLVVGSPNYTYLDRYREDLSKEIIGIEAKDWGKVKDHSIVQRACWNYWRCLTLGADSDDLGGLIILEDDVLPAKNWLDILSYAVENIEREHGEEYVLSLYTSYTGLSRITVPGKYYARYPASIFFGTQAMYFPAAMRIAFADYLQEEVFRTHYDALLSEFLKRNGIPLFVTTPSLFQHIGDVSTGLCWFFHRAERSRKTVDLKSKKMRHNGEAKSATVG